MDLRGCTFEDHPTQKGKKSFKNKKSYGILREVAQTGTIICQTKKNNLYHGLLINVLEDKIRVYIEKNDVTIFKLQFDANGKELYREDKNNQFTDITPQQFLK